MSRAVNPLRLSRRARSIEVSPTVAVSQRASVLKAQGEPVLDFSVGEPDQPTPAHVTEAAVQALHASRTRYTPAAGIPELRRAIAGRYEKDFGLAFDPDEVVATSGGKHALYVTCQALFQSGDEVVVPTPHWPTFGEAVRLSGARPVFARTREEDGFRLTARAVTRALTPRTRAVVVNSPCNPTGAVIAPDELRAIGRLARRRGLTLLYDDTYAHLVYGRSDHSPLAELRRDLPERFVVLGTASKTYCMTGWRVGWVLGPRPLARACAALISHSTQCPATFAQVGAVTALTGAQGLVRALRAEYRQRRDLVCRRLEAMPGVSCGRPDGSFYVFPRVSALLGGALPTTLELARQLLEQERVAVVPGEGFGTPGYIRISFARSMAELEDGLTRLARFFERQAPPGASR